MTIADAISNVVQKLVYGADCNYIKPLNFFIAEFGPSCKVFNATDLTIKEKSTTTACNPTITVAAVGCVFTPSITVT